MASALTADQVYAAARKAGFSADAAITMTAIAGAESNFTPTSHNPPGVSDSDMSSPTKDNSYGLWQINMYGGLGPERRKAFNLPNNSALYDPTVNAKAAYEIANHGKDFTPWSTYTDPAKPYKQYLPAAQKAALDYRATGGTGGTPSAPHPPMFPDARLPMGLLSGDGSGGTAYYDNVPIGGAIYGQDGTVYEPYLLWMNAYTPAQRAKIAVIYSPNYIKQHYTGGTDSGAVNDIGLNPLSDGSNPVAGIGIPNPFAIFGWIMQNKARIGLMLLGVLLLIFGFVYANKGSIAGAAKTIGTVAAL